MNMLDGDYPYPLSDEDENPEVECSKKVKIAFKKGGRKVYFHNHALGVEDAKQIAEELMNPKAVVKELNLGGFGDQSGNVIGAEGATAIATVLKLNSTIQLLWNMLSNVEVDDVKEIFEAWTVASSCSLKLERLILDGNEIGDEGTTAFGETLKINSTLRDPPPRFTIDCTYGIIEGSAHMLHGGEFSHGQQV
jgi:L-arabinose isomerase